MDLLTKLQEIKLPGVKSIPLEQSNVFMDTVSIPTKILLLNGVVSGDLDGGVETGITIFAAPSKHFKSMYGLYMVEAFLSAHPDAICLYYDSERGASKGYWTSVGIDTKRVIYTEISNIEELKVHMTNTLEIIDNQKVVIYIDSVGNLASKKEVDDALEGNDKADMTRAKQLKSLFRIITPKINQKEIPCIVINHTYNEIGMFPKTIMSGGTGAMYSSNNVIFITKAQETEKVNGKEQKVGNKFTLVTHKSRRVVEDKRFGVVIKFGQKPSPYTGLFDIALQLGNITKISAQLYGIAQSDAKTGEVMEVEGFKGRKRKDIEYSEDFWENEVFAKTNFKENFKEVFQLQITDLEDFDPEVEEDLDEYNEE